MVTRPVFSPHAPARLLITGNADRHAIRKLVRPATVNGRLPHGPSAKPPSYQDILDATEGGSCLADTVDSWYRKAREEWSNLCGKKLRYFRPYFKWTPASEGAKAGTKQSAVQKIWKAAEADMREAAEAVAKGDVQQRERSQRRIRLRYADASTPTGYDTIDKAVKGNIKQWAEAALTAITTSNLAWTRKLWQTASTEPNKQPKQPDARRPSNGNSSLGHLRKAN